MMKKMLTKLSAIILSGLMAATILTGCGSKSGDSDKKRSKCNLLVRISSG